MTVLVTVEAAVLVVLSVLVAGLLRAYGTLLRRLHELDGGAATAGPATAPPFRTAEGLPAPSSRDEWAAAADVAGTTLAGEIVGTRVVGAPHPTVLLFLSSGCAGCEPYWSDLAAATALPWPAGARVLVVTKDADEESPAELLRLSPPGIDLVLSSAAWRDYEVPGSPYVVVVDGPTGRVTGAGSAASLRQLGGLMGQAAGDATLAGAVRKPAADRARERDVDRELLAAGIAPGDPQLYVEPGRHR